MEALDFGVFANFKSTNEMACRSGTVGRRRCGIRYGRESSKELGSWYRYEDIQRKRRAIVKTTRGEFKRPVAKLAVHEIQDRKQVSKTEQQPALRGGAM